MKRIIGISICSLLVTTSCIVVNVNSTTSTTHEEVGHFTINCTDYLTLGNLVDSVVVNGIRINNGDTHLRNLNEYVVDGCDRYLSYNGEHFQVYLKPTRQKSGFYERYDAYSNEEDDIFNLQTTNWNDNKYYAKRSVGNMNQIRYGICSSDLSEVCGGYIDMGNNTLSGEEKCYLSKEVSTDREALNLLQGFCGSGISLYNDGSYGYSNIYTRYCLLINGYIVDVNQYSDVFPNNETIHVATYENFTKIEYHNNIGLLADCRNDSYILSKGIYNNAIEYANNIKPRENVYCDRTIYLDNQTGCVFSFYERVNGLTDGFECTETEYMETMYTVIPYERLGLYKAKGQENLEYVKKNFKVVYNLD